MAFEETAFPHLRAYLDLPVDPGGELDRVLQQAIEREQTREGVVLSDDFSHEPPDLTPEMAGWFRAHVAPLRLQALAEMKSAFQADSFGQGKVRGVLIESDLDQHGQNRRLAQKAAHDRFHRENTGLVRDRDETRHAYEEVRAGEDGREPVMPRPILYGAVLAAIMVGEFLLNFESILHVPIITSPFLATGATMFCALALGCAGHLHGELLKQWNYWFGPQDRVRRSQGLQRMALGSGALACALGFIGYARMSFITPKIQEAAILGVAPPSLWGSIAAMLLTNVIVYIISVAWSWARHDANPEYVVKAVKLERLQGQLSQRIQGLNGELTRLDAKHGQDIGRSKMVEKQQSVSPAYGSNREAFSRFQGKDAAVQGALDRYRAALVRALRADKIDPVFFVRPRLDQEDAAKTERLTAEQWLAAPVILKLVSRG